MTGMSRHHGQGREAQHFLESLIIITHKQLNERRQFLRQFGRIPTLHEFSHFLIILAHLLPCQLLRLGIDLPHLRIHIHREVVIVEVIDKCLAVIILRVVRQFLSHHRKRLFPRHQLRQTRTHHRHQVLMPVMLSEHIKSIGVQASFLYAQIEGDQVGFKSNPFLPCGHLSP